MPSLNSIFRNLIPPALKKPFSTISNVLLTGARNNYLGKIVTKYAQR